MENRFLGDYPKLAHMEPYVVADDWLKILKIPDNDIGQHHRKEAKHLLDISRNIKAARNSEFNLNLLGHRLLAKHRKNNHVAIVYLRNILSRLSNKESVYKPLKEYIYSQLISKMVSHYIKQCLANYPTTAHDKVVEIDNNKNNLFLDKAKARNLYYRETVNIIKNHASYRLKKETPSNFLDLNKKFKTFIENTPLLPNQDIGRAILSISPFPYIKNEHQKYIRPNFYWYLRETGYYTSCKYEYKEISDQQSFYKLEGLFVKQVDYTPSCFKQCNGFETYCKGHPTNWLVALLEILLSNNKDVASSNVQFLIRMIKVAKLQYLDKLPKLSGNTLAEVCDNFKIYFLHFCFNDTFKFSSKKPAKPYDDDVPLKSEADKLLYNTMKTFKYGKDLILLFFDFFGNLIYIHALERVIRKPSLKFIPPQKTQANFSLPERKDIVKTLTKKLGICNVRDGVLNEIRKDKIIAQHIKQGILQVADQYRSHLDIKYLHRQWIVEQEFRKKFRRNLFKVTTKAPFKIELTKNAKKFTTITQWTGVINEILQNILKHRGFTSYSLKTMLNSDLLKQCGTFEEDHTVSYGYWPNKIYGVKWHIILPKF